MGTMGVVGWWVFGVLLSALIIAYVAGLWWEARKKGRGDG
jgi:hypothetical protein